MDFDSIAQNLDFFMIIYMKKNTYRKIIVIFTLTLSLVDVAQAMSRGKPVEAVAVPTTKLVEGDIIFIQSQTQQAAALREATQSVWTHVGILIKTKSGWQVAEAIGPLKTTSLNDFVARSKNRSYEIYRFKFFDPATMRDDLFAVMPKYNKPYDIYFEWSEDMIYCSELTYKVFKDITGFDMGRIQKMKEMKLDGPYVKALIEKRLTDTGRELNLEEPIVTPVSQMEDPNMRLIQKSP